MLCPYNHLTDSNLQKQTLDISRRDFFDTVTINYSPVPCSLFPVPQLPKEVYCFILLTIALPS